jgi:hypothetical protein
LARIVFSTLNEFVRNGGSGTISPAVTLAGRNWPERDMTHDDQTRPTNIGAEAARQGVTGHNVRIVLAVGLALAVIAGILLFFTVGT